MGDLDLTTRKMRMSNAGCPYPYHFEAEKGEAIELQADAYPLGVRPDTEYTVLEAQIQPGDYAIFCSDGIPEAEDADGVQFGY
jgi:sigma-B regulation protein RsbU (phosphoserine phosphatase)